MIHLTGTSDAVTLVTNAAGTVHVHVSFIDLTASTSTPNRVNTPAITSATTTTIVASPAASTQRAISFVNISNVSALQPVGVTVNLTDGTNNSTLCETTVPPGSYLRYQDAAGWQTTTS